MGGMGVRFPSSPTAPALALLPVFSLPFVLVLEPPLTLRSSLPPSSLSPALPLPFLPPPFSLPPISPRIGHAQGYDGRAVIAHRLTDDGRVRRGILEEGGEAAIRRSCPLFLLHEGGSGRACCTLLPFVSLAITPRDETREERKPTLFSTAAFDSFGSGDGRKKTKSGSTEQSWSFHKSKKEENKSNKHRKRRKERGRRRIIGKEGRNEGGMVQVGTVKEREGSICRR